MDHIQLAMGVITCSYTYRVIIMALNHLLNPHYTLFNQYVQKQNVPMPVTVSRIKTGSRDCFYCFVDGEDFILKNKKFLW